MAKALKVQDWERLLAHAAILQAKVPSAILVGGTAAALHAHYDTAMAALESIVGWQTKRRVRGKLVLGEIDKIEAGVRNQRRSAPLETTALRLRAGLELRVPTIEEMLRIKAFLLVERNATRDYLDVAALSHHLGAAKSVKSVEVMGALYAEFTGEGGDIVLTVVMKLANPDPYDLTDVDLTEYKGIIAPWNDWRAVEAQCRLLATRLLDSAPAG